MDKTIEWLFAAESDDGGIAAWNDGGKWHKSYPEVTGYLLPTLIEWRADELALRCTEWLLSIQNADGSWNGLDGTPRPFDTAAIIEGLEFVAEFYPDHRYVKAAERAKAWMNGLITANGYLPNSPQNKSPEVYNLRASAIIGNGWELAYWQDRGLNEREQRSHYWAYALEGALRFDQMNEWARRQIVTAYHTQTGLIPFYVRPDWEANHPSVDYCASAQMALLYRQVGLDATKVFRLLKNVVESNGGIPQADSDGRQIAWAAKFYLDLKKEMQS